MGPLAAMFGREFQQYLLENKGTDKISKARMQHSVDCGRSSMSQKRVEEVYHEYVDDNYDDDRASQVSKRTRSPRKTMTPFCGAPWAQSPSNRRNLDIREQHDDRRIRDVRQCTDDERVRDRRDRDRQPRDKEPRGSSVRCNYDQHEEERFEPRPYERKSKERQTRPDDRDRDRDRRTSRSD